MMGKITRVEHSRVRRFESVGMQDVVLEDSLLRRRMDTNRRHALAHQYHECERTGRMDNLRIAAGLKEGALCGNLAGDTDIYKWLEAISYAVAYQMEEELKSLGEKVAPLIVAAQEEDGYINTSFLSDRADRRWKDLYMGHELYTGGHLIQAAIAWKRATGRSDLLDVAVRWADHVDRRCGPGKPPLTGGHPEVEMALVELFRETGNVAYLKLSEFLVEQRGRNLLKGSAYVQDHAPVRQQTTMEGHAVRQLYLLCGITDLYAETGDESLMQTMEAQWADFTDKKMAITGGAGARYEGESFGGPYEIPNRTGYYETCAAIASFMWNWRMLQATGEARFGDVMERTLYNGILSGISLDGRSYFYTNPLEHDGGTDLTPDHRGSNRRTTDHFNHVACCPPNVARLLCALPGYLYGVNGDEVYVHHYAAGRVRCMLDGGPVELVQTTNYPWDGRITIGVHAGSGQELALMLRIPAWAGGAVMELNGTLLDEEVAAGRYCSVRRRWSAGDEVTLVLPMELQRVHAHPRVAGNSGCVALMRGPVVYCIESEDYPGEDIYRVVLPGDAVLACEYDDAWLGGVAVVTGEAALVEADAQLYSTSPRSVRRRVDFKAIPYFAWANRSAGAMRVWLPTDDGGMAP